MPNDTVPAAATGLAKDPVRRLCHDWHVLQQRMDRPDVSDEMCSVYVERQAAIEDEIVATIPTTLMGVSDILDILNFRGDEFGPYDLDEAMLATAKAGLEAISIKKGGHRMIAIADAAAEQRMKIDVLNDLIDRALRRGAVYLVRQTEHGPVFGCYDGVNGEGPQTTLITQALESATMGSWPLCRRLIFERAVAAGGALYSNE